jgi:hypothetical protein
LDLLKCPRKNKKEEKNKENKNETNKQEIDNETYLELVSFLLVRV